MRASWRRIPHCVPGTVASQTTGALTQKPPFQMGCGGPFPKVAHLLQYVDSGAYYARVKVRGKLIRESLQTQVRSTPEWPAQPGLPQVPKR
jgi:hypothetical protein